MVIGRGSDRTRCVLQVLEGLGPIWWPNEPSRVFDRIARVHLACVVLADDLTDEPVGELLTRLRELHPVLPIFVVTDVNDVADAVQAMRLGATAAVELPPSAGLLREYVIQALQ